MDLDKLTTGDKVVAGTGIVLIIGLLFFPWHKVDAVEVFGQTVGGGSASAVGSPNGFWGILALLLVIALVGVVLAEKLGNVELPELPIPWSDAKFYASIAVLVLLLLKLVIETDYLGWGCYLCILVAAGMVYGGFLTKNEATGTSSAPPSSF